MTDDKISCNFNYESGNYNDKSYKSAYYEKVFDSWEDFTSYAEEFLKYKSNLDKFKKLEGFKNVSYNKTEEEIKKRKNRKGGCRKNLSRMTRIKRIQRLN